MQGGNALGVWFYLTPIFSLCGVFVGAWLTHMFAHQRREDTLAIDFVERISSELCGITDHLEETCRKGTFTDDDLHLVTMKLRRVKTNLDRVRWSTVIERQDVVDIKFPNFFNVATDDPRSRSGRLHFKHNEILQKETQLVSAIEGAMRGKIKAYRKRREGLSGLLKKAYR